jgi:hypothetical protein
VSAPSLACSVAVHQSPVSIARLPPRPWRGGTVTAVGNLGVNAILLIGSIGGDRAQRAGDLIEQETKLGRIVDLFAGQRRRYDLAGAGIHAEVQLPPRPARPGATPLDQPFPRTSQLQAGAVHQQVQELRAVAFVGVVQLWLWPSQRRRTNAKRSVVGHAQGQAEQTDD